MFIRRGVQSAILLGLIFSMAFGGMGWADTFPSKPINLWIAWGAGSTADVTSRAIANAASKTLGQPILASNVTGGGGTLVLGRVKGEEPNGYTIAHSATGQLSRSPHLQPVPFNAEDPLSDFVPIISYYPALFGIAVRSDSPWKTLEEFINYAKANPGKIRYSTSGTGTGQHLTMEYLAKKENIKWTHVPFATSPQAVAAVLGGHVEAVAQTPEWQEHVIAGKLRLLATMNDRRMPNFPDVPTLMEKGYDWANISLETIYAPVKTPKETVNTLYKALRQACETEEVKKIISQLGLYLELHDTEELTQIIKKDYERQRTLIKDLGIGIYKKN